LWLRLKAQIGPWYGAEYPYPTLGYSIERYSPLCRGHSVSRRLFYDVDRWKSEGGKGVPVFLQTVWELKGRDDH